MSDNHATPQPWELAPVTFTVGQLKQMLLAYWFAEPPASLDIANRDLDMKLAAELASHQGIHRDR